MVGLLALAHDRGVEGEIAATLDALLDAGELPDLASIQSRFTPRATSAPPVRIDLPRASAYDPLLSASCREIAA
jgi:hypothetical protein